MVGAGSEAVHAVESERDAVAGRIHGDRTEEQAPAVTFEGERLLIVQLEGGDGRPEGEPILTFDRLGARRGDRVIVTNDGAALQALLGRTTPGRWSKGRARAGNRGDLSRK